MYRDEADPPIHLELWLWYRLVMAGMHDVSFRENLKPLKTSWLRDDTICTFERQPKSTIQGSFLRTKWTTLPICNQTL